MIDPFKTDDLSGSQATKGNISSGLTAIDRSVHIDYDCSAILKGEMTLEESGDNLINMLIRTCEGRLTAQEVLGHEEFVLTKLYESA